MEHFRFEGQGHPLAYKSRRGGGGGERRVRPNPAAHGKRLGEELGDAVGETPSEAILAIDYYDGTRGRLIAFELDYAYAGADPTIDEFGGGKYGIELVRVDRLEARRRRVLLYVPLPLPPSSSISFAPLRSPAARRTSTGPASRASSVSRRSPSTTMTPITTPPTSRPFCGSNYGSYANEPINLSPYAPATDLISNRRRSCSTIVALS